MSKPRSDSLDQQLDISGSLNPNGSLLPLTDESEGLGAPINSGAAASVFAAGLVSGLLGFTSNSVGNYLTIFGAENIGNNGTFIITQFIDATSVRVVNAFSSIDGYNGSISWIQRQPYCLEDDLNYARTDRAAIKGVGYDQPVPTYYRCTDLSSPVFANLTNIAGNTTDAKSIISSRKYYGASITSGESSYLIIDIGSLKHADFVDMTGVPIYDGADAGNDEATYVDITGSEGQTLEVLSGVHAGEIIFGRTLGVGSVSPNSVTVEFRSGDKNDPLGTSSAYIWEELQITTVNLYYPYRNCLDTMPETELRSTAISSSCAGNKVKVPTQVGELLFSLEDDKQWYVVVPVTSNAGWLVNDYGLLLVNEDS